MFVAVAVYGGRFFTAEPEFNFGLLTAYKALALTASVSLQVNPVYAVGILHRGRLTADAYFHAVAVNLNNGAVLFTALVFG